MRIISTGTKIKIYEGTFLVTPLDRTTWSWTDWFWSVDP